MIVKNSTVPTMDNTIYKLFLLLILTCLSDLVVLFQHIILWNPMEEVDHLCTHIGK